MQLCTNIDQPANIVVAVVGADQAQYGSPSESNEENVDLHNKVNVVIIVRGSDVVVCNFASSE